MPLPKKNGAITSEGLAKPIKSSLSGGRVEALIFSIVAALLVASRLGGYLLFHSLAELFSICIAATYFVIALHTRKINENPSLAALGISYLFVAVLDTFHVLSYAGMGVFQGGGYPANQVWLLARFLEALSLLLFTFIRRAEGGSLFLVFGIGSSYTLAGLASVFIFKVFPACYVKGLGQTPFKVGTEILIMLLLAAASIAFHLRRKPYSRPVYLNLQFSIWLTLLSELSFTLYLSNYDWVNMTGHLIKILSFYLVYRSIITTGLVRPHELLFSRISEKNEALERSNDTKDTFISILSHDLRSPLSGIQSAAAYLAEDPARMDEDEAKVLVREMALAAAASLNLVENVLQWARCQNGAIVPELAPLDVAKLLKSQAELLGSAAKDKGIRIEIVIDAAPTIRSDANMLSAILRNLLQNAVKFSHPGASIEARLSLKGGDCLVELRDRGVGMSQAALSKLFRLDERLRSLGTSGEKGTGFGLILASEFVRVLGGRLEAESEEGRGSLFRLSLPAG